ncbi:MAG TPA: hypothetical protein VKV32_01005, partial [Stellaceae bacterium]|nr:hypothetical protein [Stellaceae bacterium]
IEALGGGWNANQLPSVDQVKNDTSEPAPVSPPTAAAAAAPTPPAVAPANPPPIQPAAAP